MYPSVTNVAALDNYMLVVDFDNGESRQLDMKPYLDFGVFKRLKDTQEFDRVMVSLDTIKWPSGVDLDPEFVYDKSVFTPKFTGDSIVELLAMAGAEDIEFEPPKLEGSFFQDPRS